MTLHEELQESGTLATQLDQILKDTKSYKLREAIRDCISKVSQIEVKIIEEMNK